MLTHTHGHPLGTGLAGDCVTPILFGDCKLLRAVLSGSQRTVCVGESCAWALGAQTRGLRSSLPTTCRNQGLSLEGGRWPLAYPLSHHVLDPVPRAHPLSSQIVKGLKFMLDMDIGRTTCKKTGHTNLDDCSFQTNHTLQWVRGGLASLSLAPPPTTSTASRSPSALLSP